jgi:hypothetical protein
MKLYFIASGDRDLFIWATSPAQALELWMQYWELEGDEDQPNWVFEIPTEPPAEPGAIDWHVSV